jgi:hypothetical protein
MRASGRTWRIALCCVTLFVSVLPRVDRGLPAATGRVNAQANAAQTGIFEGRRDFGAVLHAGSTEYDVAKHAYTLGGSGENMWFGKDEFQFAWSKMSGDVTLSADITFPVVGKIPIAKRC